MKGNPLIIIILLLLQKSTNSLQQKQCNSTTDCNTNQLCVSEKCTCQSEYSSLTSNSSACNYKKKSQKTAFLLELFVGFGGGHVYSERFVNGFCKIVILPVILLIILLYNYLLKNDIMLLSQVDKNKEENGKSLIKRLVFVLFLTCVCSGIAFWIIYDVIHFGLNKYLDGNGVELISWKWN